MDTESQLRRKNSQKISKEKLDEDLNNPYDVNQKHSEFSLNKNIRNRKNSISSDNFKNVIYHSNNLF